MFTTIPNRAERDALEAELPLLRSRAIAERSLRSAGRSVGPFAGAQKACAAAEARLRELNEHLATTEADAAFLAAYDEYQILLNEVAQATTECEAARRDLHENPAFDYDVTENQVRSAQLLGRNPEMPAPLAVDVNSARLGLTLHREPTDEERRAAHRAGLFIAAETRLRNAQARLATAEERAGECRQHFPALTCVQATGFISKVSA